MNSRSDVSDYVQTSKYWNKYAENEIESKVLVPHRYTAEQCVTAFEKAIKYIRTPDVVALKTDLWTEGIAREREVLERCLKRVNYYNIKFCGIDISDVVVRKAKQFLPWIELKQGNITQIPYNDNTFDIVYDCSTIDHVSYNNAHIALEEYSRVLKSKGVMCLMFTPEGGTLDRKNKVDTDYFAFNINRIKNYIDNIGFEIKEEYCIHFLSTKPLSYLMYIGMLFGGIYNMNWFVKKVSEFEFSNKSKKFVKFSPMYVIIAQKS